MAERIEILDTTLRDGEQTPGIAWTLEQKFAIAKKLDYLGVDVIEFGFPIVSEAEIQLGQMLRKAKISAKLCALARPEEKDILAVVKSRAQRVNIFVPCSQIQAKAFKKPLNVLFANTLKAVGFAKKQGLEVEITLMDAARAEKEKLIPFAGLLEKRGVTILTLSDTVGTMDAFSTYEMFKEVKNQIKKAKLSVHVHNDRGQATAMTLAAVRAGAGQVHVTVGGLGDRAGNASLEEVVIGLRDQLGVRTRIKTNKIAPIIQRIANLGHFRIPERKPIIGKAAHMHQAGLHMDKESVRGFEAFPAERVGLRTQFLFGKGTGRGAVEALATRAKKQLTPEQVKELVVHFKKQGLKGKVFSEAKARRALTRKFGK